MTHRARTRAAVEIEGLTGIHAIRAVWTALAAVPGVVSAEVDMTGVRLELDGPLDQDALSAALEAAGVRLVTVTITDARVLPIL